MGKLSARRSFPLLLLTLLLLPASLGRAEPASAITQVEQLKSEAFRALRQGQFDRVHELIDRAASLSSDPALLRMSDWVSAFQKQRDAFRAERRKSYEAEVEKVKKLVEADMPDFALRAAAVAYSYAEDKDGFRKLPWVDELVRVVTRRADDYEASGQWLKALRLFSDLVAIDPSNVAWKEHQKLSFRRVRLVSMYTPDRFKEIQEADLEQRKAADAVLNPTTQPTTMPTTMPDDVGEAFRVNWRDSLQGVRMDMLRDALDNARANYLRDIGYAELMVGGLKAIRALLTTDGLDEAFPALADDVKRRQFLDVVDEHLASLNNNGAADRAAMQKLLTRLQTVNVQTVGLPDEVLVSEFADGAFGELDPFTSVIWPSEVAEFNKSTQGEFSGVGIQIQSDPDGSLKVVSPLEDSPAFRARIRAGDVITHINGKNAKGITTTQAVKIITGPPGTEVTLTVRSPDGTTREISLIRQTIKVASLKGWRHLPGGGWEYFVDPENKIGYLRLTNFSKETSSELQRALEELNNAGASGVVLDLRYNPGGLLTAAADVSDAFLREGAIVSTRSDRPDDRNQPVLTARRQRTDSDVPLVVLVNQYSASASEIVSGALKDHKRAVIVGERTFGKGSVQMLFPLANRAAYLKLTTSHYFLPSGRCIHREESSTVWGVDPDVLVEMTPEQMRAAIDARSELDVLHDDAQDDADQARRAEQAAMTLLDSDPQLNAALLLLRMHLAGAPLL